MHSQVNGKPAEQVEPLTNANKGRTCCLLGMSSYAFAVSPHVFVIEGVSVLTREILMDVRKIYTLELCSRADKSCILLLREE
jgi:hypothetical protein